MIESEQNQGDETMPSASENAENVSQNDENKVDDASVAVESGVGESIAVSDDQPTEKVEVETVDKKEGDESEAKAMEDEGLDTTIDEEFDSDFDNIEEIDPSYEIDANLWKPINSFDEVDLKPPKAAPVEGQEEKKEKKKEEVVEDKGDDEWADLYKIRTEKEKDQEFREFIRELRRPKIVAYLPDRVAAKGTTVRLTCSVEGNNIMTRWTKDDVPLERKKNVQTRSDGEIHTLEITDITTKDAGVYTAYFKNRAGEVETSSRIRVFDGSLHKPDHIDIALVKGE